MPIQNQLVRAASAAALAAILSASSLAQIGTPIITKPFSGGTVGTNVIFSGNCDVTTTQVDVRVDGSNVGAATISGGTQWGFLLAGLSDAVHSVEARATDGATTSSWSPALIFTVNGATGPGTPTQPYGPSPTAANMRLRWAPVTGAAAYNVYRDLFYIANTSGTSFAESSPLADGTYSYHITAVDGLGQEGSYSTVRFFEQNAAWPANVLKVGSSSTEGFWEISQAAGWMQSHSLSNTTILVDTGTYQAFTASQGFRLYAVPGETVFIDTSSTAMVLAGAGQTEPYELVGIQFASTGGVQLSVNDCTRPVVLSNCLFSGSTATSLGVTGSREVAIHQCSVGGLLPISLTNYSLVFMNGGDLTATGGNAIYAGQASHLVCTGTSISGAINTTATSVVDQLAGTVMRLTADCTVTAGAVFPISFEGAPGQPWGLATHLSTSLQFVGNPAVGVDGALLLDAATAVIVYEGTTAMSGFDVPTGGLPVDPYFAGYPVQLQAAGWEPNLGVWRLSNEVTIVATP